MKNLFSKRLVYRLTKIRIFAVALLLGLTAFWIWNRQVQPETTQSVFIVTFPPEPPKSESILQDRNLADYEQLNISNCVYKPVSKRDYQNCSDSLDKGRKFILDQWKEKKRTYILYTCAGYHGETEYHIFIEPDDSGNWHIVHRRKTYYTTIGWENMFRVDSTEAFSVRRVRKTNDDDIYTDGKFYLEFLDKNGERTDIL